MRLLDAGYLWAPGGVVASWSEPTITFSTTHFSALGIADIGGHFVAGAYVNVYDADGAIYEAQDIASVGTNTITLANWDSTFVPVAGDRVAIGQYDTTISPACAAGYDVKDDVLFGCDGTTGILGAAKDPAKRWV